MSVRRYVEAPEPATLRAWCWAVFAAPFVVILVAAAASRLLTTLPSGWGTFVPSPQAMSLSYLGAALCGAVFAFLVSRLYRHPTEDIFLHWRGNSTSHRPPWLVGGTLFALVAMLSPQVLCGAINQAIGQVTYEHWPVRYKKHAVARGECEYWVTLASPTTADSAQVCMPRERWDRTQVDDSVTIMTISSGFGARSGPAPDANQQGSQQ